ncbi:hypothetical protein ACUUL3_06100 [Thiovibrio sp. JS02]
MGKEARRAPRIAASLAVTLILRETEGSQVIAEPIMGSLVDMSTYGVRVTVNRIRAGKYHLFYSFNDEESRVINLEVIDPEEMVKLVIPMHPVWFDHILSEPCRPFHLGLEFLVPPDNGQVARLHQLLAAQQKSESGWLKRLLKFA